MYETKGDATNFNHRPNIFHRKKSRSGSNTKHSSFSPWNRPYYSPCNDIIFSLLPSVVGYICVKVSSVKVVAFIPALHDICRQNAESHIHHYELLLCSIIVPNTVPIAIHTSRSTLAYIIVIQHTTSS